MNLSQISAVIIAKNAQSTILECLESLKNFDEIILLDNESTDATLEIAKSFNAKHGNLRIFHSPFIGFGALKNLATSKAKNEWIFSIDSDEVLEDAAAREIDSLALDTHAIYALPRKNLYNGEWIKACGWYPDYVKRLFNRQTTRFNDNQVHESVIVPKNAHRVLLKNGLKHYAFRSIEGLLDKLQRYTSYSAQEKFARGKRTTMFAAIARLGLVFFKDYFLRKGVFYGYRGFIIAFCNALGAFFRYAKLYELQNKHKREKQ